MSRVISPLGSEDQGDVKDLAVTHRDCRTAQTRTLQDRYRRYRPGCNEHSVSVNCGLAL